MQFPHHALIGAAANIPVNSPVPVVSFSPLVLPAGNRPIDVDLQLRVTAPSTGDGLAIVLFSHGLGSSNWLSSLDGYAPLAEFWAAHGFVVIQPTHLDSAFLNVTGDAPAGQEFFWQSQARDLSRVLDELDAVDAAVPGLGGRLDRAKVAVAGHSFGAWTASVLLGARNVDPRTGEAFDAPERRVKAGVVLAGTGAGGADISETGRRIIPFYGPDFSTMNTPALVVYGDEDASPFLSNRGADWHADPYTLAPGPKALFTVKGGKHGLGGVSGPDAAETEDESPERLGAVQRMTWAYLRSQLFEGDTAWEEACKALGGLGQLGTVEQKGEGKTRGC
ncbi:hypothetical protein DL769_008544 [Monosporascus sp. CRB-8-3]|nr:hypothetical protein DL769_008544 [Monosporascus sp. CRB-8-3]